MKSELILHRGNEKVIIEKGSDIIELIKKLSENESGKSFEISKLIEDRDENRIKGYIYDDVNGLMILKDYQDKIFYFKEDILEQLSKVYNINTLCIMKVIAYIHREKIGDLYDLTFIVNNYFENLDQQIINIVQKNIEYNGIERLDYLIQSQKDEIINKKKLVVDFVAMSDKLGLLYSNKEREIINSYNIILGR